jgi:outer membrane protein OmpA-like peptidoglycan-associated protein
LHGAVRNPEPHILGTRRSITSNSTTVASWVSDFFRLFDLTRRLSASSFWFKKQLAGITSMVGESIAECRVRALVLVSALGAFALGEGGAAALPGDSLDRAPPLFQLIQDTTGGSVATETARPNAVETPPFLQLNDALAATRAKVEKLARAAEMARTVGELRHELAKTRTENQRLIDQLGRVRTEVTERRKAGQAADDRIAELTTAAHHAATEAARARQEVTDVNRHNAVLNERLADVRAELASAKAQIEEADVARDSRMKELVHASEQSDAESIRLQNRMVAIERSLEGLVRTNVTARGRIAELQRSLEAERQVATRLNDQLSRAQAEFAKAGEARAAAEEERDAARLQAAFLGTRLRADLAAANEKLKQVMAKNGELEAELGSLRAAAASAADAAQENMLAVASRIEALDAALGGVAPTVEAESDRPGAAGERRLVTSEATEMDPEVATEGETTLDQPAATEASLSEQPNGAAAVTSPRSSQIRSNMAPDQAERPDPKAAAAPGPLADLTVGLSPEARLQAQRLLEELGAQADQRGLVVTVPGASLFQTDSERIDEAAHGVLAKLAELVKLYDGRKALIVGHTDAVGDAAYNRYLATRRAEVIKEFLVENFEVEQARLSIEGEGEEQPIASNATPDGRRANRRVEVLLLE